MKKRKNLLDLKARKLIHDTIQDQPGICTRELERTTGLALGELTYHLPILLNSCLINEEKDTFFRRFYPSTISKEERVLLSLLRREAIRRIIPFLLSAKTITNKNLSEALSISPSTASWHIERLKKNNLIIETRIKNQRVYELNNRSAIKKMYCR